MQIGMLINSAFQFNDWVDIYKKLTYWQLELGPGNDPGMNEVIKMQKAEANKGFSRFIKTNYTNWFNSNKPGKPLISTGIFPQKVFPLLEKTEKVCFVLIDNLRYDLWRSMIPLIEDYYKIESEEIYCSILPTATQYARNAMFAGLMPMEIEDIFPNLWIDEEEEGGKNILEDKLLERQIQRHVKKIRFKYEKVNNSKGG